MNPDQQQPAAPTPPAPFNPNASFTPGPASAPAPMGGAPAVAGPKKANKNVIIAVIVGVLVVAGAVAYGVYAYVSNLPDNLMKAAVSNLKDERSLAGTFKVTNDAAGTTILSGDVAINTDSANSKNGEVLLGLGTGADRVGVSALTLDSTLYLKLSNLENIGPVIAGISKELASLNTPAFGAALKNLDDKWFILTKDDVNSLTASSGSNIDAAVSAADLKKALSLYDQHPFVKSDKTYADEVIDGSNSAHFSLKVDKTENVAFLQALKDANLDSFKVTDADIATVKNAPDTATSTLEVWIARDTKKFKQVRLTNTEKGNEFSFLISLTSKLPTFDKFEKPAGARPLSDITSLIYGADSLLLQ